MFLLHPSEVERLGALRNVEATGSPPEPQLDAICRTAQGLFGVSVALVSLVGQTEQGSKAQCGLATDGMAREVSAFAQIILSDGVFVLEDATQDDRFASNPLVTGEPHIRFYAGAPLTLSPGIHIGALSIIDRVPRTFSPEQQRQLQGLAQIVVAQLRMHRAVDQARGREERHKHALATAQDAFVSIAANGTITQWNPAAEVTFGWSEPEVLGRSLAEIIIPERFRAAHERGIQRYLQSGQSTVIGKQRLELVALRRDGTEFPVEMAIAAETFGRSTFSAFLRDISERKQREQALASSEARYRLLADNTTDMIVRADRTSARLYVSPASRLLLGYEPEELIGSRPLDAIHPDDIEQARSALSSILSGAVSRAVCCQRTRRKDNSWVWTETCYSLTHDPSTGEPDGYVASVRDISERRAAEEDLRRSEARLRESEQRLALALESGSDGVWDWNVHTGDLWSSDRLLGMLGFSPGEFAVSLGTWASLIHPDDRETATNRFYDHLSGRSPAYECEHRLRRKDGQYAWILARGRVVSRDASGRASRVVGTHIDITQRKKAEERIAYLARHDVLTDLPNRALFNERVEQRLAEIKRRGGHCALLYGDLDRFKLVNDTLGHHAGDALLAEVARRLRSGLRQEDTVARLGGDEFAIMQVGDGAQPGSAAALARRLIESVSQPVTIGDRTVEVGLSLGIAVAPADGLDSDPLLRHADLALYRAKAEGRNTFRFYKASLEEGAEAKRQRVCIARPEPWAARAHRGQDLQPADPR